ncbi:MAG: ribonuclease Z [Promethearchaeota archaeon]
MDLIFLGTSGATPTQHRNLPAIALRLDSGHLVIFDTGEDIQRQFEAANLKFNVPTTIFISHLHGDHVIGLPGLLFNFHLNSRSKALTIVGPLGLASFLMSLHQIVGLKASNYALTVKEIVPPQTNTEVKEGTEKIEDTEDTENTENEGVQVITYINFLKPTYERSVSLQSHRKLVEKWEYTVKFSWMVHSVPTMAFRFEEAPLDGKFSPERALELRVPKGPLWKRMQKGQSITLKNGTVIDPVDSGIVTPPRKGRIIVYSADTAKCEAIVSLAHDADYFVCEATYGTEHEELAVEKKHLTSKFAGEIAQEAQVKHLILTHFSSRYKDVSVLLQEAQAIFPQTQVAEDLLQIAIHPWE